MLRRFKIERRVAATIFTELPAIDPDSRGSHHAAEINENALALPVCRQSEMPAIDGDKLVLLIVKPVPRQHLIRVRERYAFEAGIVEYRLRSVRVMLFAEEPVVIKRDSSRPHSCRLLRVSGAEMLKQRETGESRAPALKKISPVECFAILHDWRLSLSWFRKKSKL